MWDPGYSELWVVNSDGTGNRKLLGTSPYATYYIPAAISWDNTKVFYNIQNYYGAKTNAVFVINIDGTGNQFFVGDPSIIYAVGSISPDGTRIILNRNNELWQIHLFSNQQAKLSGSVSVFGIGWHPDGQYSNPQKNCENWSPFILNMGILSIEKKLMTKQLSNEAPTLLDPADGKEIQTLRPTFSFKAPKDIYSEYKILWSQMPNAEGDGKATKQNSSGSEISSDPGKLNFAYKPDEIFDPAMYQHKTLHRYRYRGIQL
jgi:hypothetical protein